MLASPDYQTILERIARAAVPFLADWCVIDLIGQKGQGGLAAVAHADPAHEPLVRELQQRFPASATPEVRRSLALHQGRATVLPTPVAPPPAADKADDERLRLLEALQPTTCLLVPLRMGDAGIGVLWLTRCGHAIPYSDDDLLLAEEVARRATLVLENARLFAAAERSRAVAEEALQLRDTFFSLAAHELRTPLTTLLGRSQLIQKWLAEEGSDERNLRSIGIIIEQAQRLNSMISALLDVSRIQSGRFSIDPGPLDLGALVRRVVDETRPTLSLHTLTLHIEGEPLLIEGDEMRLRQVLQGLLNNAVKYSPAGGDVRVEARSLGDKARLRVSDPGIGIPAEAQGQLFKRFYRAPNAERRGTSGLGIGLFVANEIIEQHQGRIEVASAEGAGSTFTVQLPLRPPCEA